MRLTPRNPFAVLFLGLCEKYSDMSALRPVPGPLVLNTEVLDLGECTAQTFQGFEGGKKSD